MSTNTLNKRHLGRNKSIQRNGHQYLILHLCSNGGQLIPQLSDIGQVSHHNIYLFHTNGWNMVSQNHMLRNIRVLKQLNQGSKKVLTCCIFNNVRDEIILHWINCDYVIFFLLLPMSSQLCWIGKFWNNLLNMLLNFNFLHTYLEP
jgi:hypothetical protein